SPGGPAEKEIALVQNFAAQAVIAIENTRLLNELRQRTTDLSETLEQQTATSEVLKVISTSPTDANPVFEAILESACRLCDSQLAAIFRFDGTLLHLAATKNWPAEAVETLASRGRCRQIHIMQVGGWCSQRVLSFRRIHSQTQITIVTQREQVAGGGCLAC